MHGERQRRQLQGEQQAAAQTPQQEPQQQAHQVVLERLRRHPSGPIFRNEIFHGRDAQLLQRQTWRSLQDEQQG